MEAPRREPVGRRAVGRNRPAEARWSTLDQLLSLQARSQADLMARTEWAVKDLAKQVGGLSNALGGSLDDFACDLVPERAALSFTRGVMLPAAG
jgi:hypothetical protein